MILEINQYGSCLKRDHDCFVVLIKEEKYEYPSEKIDTIIVSKNSLISSSALNLCYEKNIHLFILDKFGKPIGKFWPAKQGKNTKLRRDQYLLTETIKEYEIVKMLLDLKIKTELNYLKSLSDNRKGLDKSLLNSIELLSQSHKKIKALKNTENYKQSALGIEGNSARIYFNALTKITPNKYNFHNREKRLPKDYINACLNYGYGILYSEIEKIILLSGLDPNAGILHEDQYGKPTLSFDIIETQRAKIDKIIISMFNRKKPKDSWFKIDELNQIELLSPVKKEILSEYKKIKPNLQKDVWKTINNIISLMEK